MEIVIDIPKDRYKEILQGDYIPDGNFRRNMIEAVRNGTPLPKGHGRLKDVDWIDDNCEHHYSDKDGSWCYTWKDIDNTPTIVEADTISGGAEE